MGTPRNGPWLKVLLGGVAAGMVLLTSPVFLYQVKC